MPFTVSQSSSSRSSRARHPILSVKSFLFLISLSVLLHRPTVSVHSLCFLDPPVLRPSFFPVHEQEVWPKTSQSPLPGSWFDLWFSVQPQLLASTALHVLLTFSSQYPATSCLFLFSQKASVKFKPLFHSSRALLFLNFTVNSFSLHFFLFFSGMFSFSEAHLTLSGCY